MLTIARILRIQRMLRIPRILRICVLWLEPVMDLCGIRQRLHVGNRCLRKLCGLVAAFSLRVKRVQAQFSQHGFSAHMTSPGLEYAGAPQKMLASHGGFHSAR